MVRDVGSSMAGPAEFDGIAPVYDETRSPPTEEEVRTLATTLGPGRSVLEAGVGTGRFAVPLGALGFHVVGVDLSREMLRRARAKGLSALVRADVRRLPLRDADVDAAYMVHVLQLLPDPRPVLAELGRVARDAVVVLLPEWSERAAEGPARAARDRYRALAAELGHPLPERPPRYHHSLEELAALAPPKAVQRIERAPNVPRTSEERFARWEARAVRQWGVPAELHQEIVRRLLAERVVEPGRWQRPRAERFVAWSPQDLRAIA